MLKIDFENQILALFDVYFWPFNMSHEKINTIFVISAIRASIWNVFIKFRWHDEKLRQDNTRHQTIKPKLAMIGSKEFDIHEIIINFHHF